MLGQLLGIILGIVLVVFSILFLSPYGSLFFTLAAIFSIWLYDGIPPALISELDSGDLFARYLTEVGALGQVPPDEAVYMFVCAALP